MPLLYHAVNGLVDAPKYGLIGPAQQRHGALLAVAEVNG